MALEGSLGVRSTSIRGFGDLFFLILTQDRWQPLGQEPPIKLLGKGAISQRELVLRAR